MAMFILFEHAAGYALFNADKDIAEEEVQKFASKLKKFKELCTFVAFQPFKTGRDALENINCVSEGLLHSQLEEFLVNNLPKKKKKFVLGIVESKLAVAIAEKLEFNCVSSSLVAELVRGIRRHFVKLVEGFDESSAANKAQLGLGHSYSRARVKFNVNKIDNMIIQSISLVDQLDKDINTFTMRVREWYSHHFPELIKVVSENTLYIQCVRAIRDRKNMADNVEEALSTILNDSVKVQNVLELARSSMGMDISEVDLENVYDFAERVITLTKRRKEMMEYLRNKMHNVAPNLATLIGEVVGARLISHAGSLVNLAKAPASTVQILGAEKALFRALKTRGNTPKYGLLFHSKFIGKAAKSNKGRISRFLANKCAVASRIDCFREVPTTVFGEKLREQVEERLKFYETGELPKKNIDVMDTALEEADIAQEAILKKIKKAKKKARRERLEASANGSFLSTDSISEAKTEEEADVSQVEKKKKKRKLDASVDSSSFLSNDSAFEAKTEEEGGMSTVEKKKKRKKSDSFNGSFLSNGPDLETKTEEEGDGNPTEKKKKKKKRKSELDQSQGM